MKKTSETEAPVKYGCEFCKASFVREKTVLSHICEGKHRWLEKDKQGNRIAFQTWLQFYAKNSMGKKNRTQAEFIKSAYYTAFLKYGNYCAAVNVINVARYTDWLLAEQIKIDNWCQDSNYTKFIISYMKVEDPLDAVARSIENTMKLAAPEKLQPCDYLRYTNPNKICYAISSGKISPWMLYQSNSGTKLLDELNDDQVNMIIDYISPEQWAIKFNKDPETAKQVKGLLQQAGY